MKIIQGAFSRAFLNKPLILEAPRPTNNSMNCEALHAMKGTSASPAIAFANSVLPVPGGPLKRQPRGTLAPASVNLSGFLRN